MLRRSRLQKLALTALIIGAVALWAIFSGRIAGWAPAVIWGAFVVGAFTWLWLTEGRNPDIPLGEVEFSDEVCAMVDRGNGSSLIRSRLLVGEGTIALRSPGLPHTLARMIGMDYTLRAADYELRSGGIGGGTKLTTRVANLASATRFPVEWEPSVVLTGPYRRGRIQLNFFKSRSTSRAEVELALTRAGAHPADDG